MDFELARDMVLNSTKDQRNELNGYGIGTLSEKTVHAILKRYYEPDTDYHEIPIKGCVADIFRDNRIYEIQTANFNKLRTKLDRFLPEYEVTVVYPIVHTKYLIWVDPETGKMSGRRKSPKTGDFTDAFYELYKIKSYLGHRNLNIDLVMMDVEEYRLLNGWSQDRKRGSCRYDRIPYAITGEMHIECSQDYIQFLPYELPDEFTSLDYEKTAHISEYNARTGINILKYLELIDEIGRKGRRKLYIVKD